MRRFHRLPFQRVTSAELYIYNTGHSDYVPCCRCINLVSCYRCIDLVVCALCPLLSEHSVHFRQSINVPFCLCIIHAVYVSVHCPCCLCVISPCCRYITSPAVCALFPPAVCALRPLVSVHYAPYCRFITSPAVCALFPLAVGDYAACC